MNRRAVKRRASAVGPWKYLVVVALLLAGCVDAESGAEPGEFYDPGSQVTVSEPLAFTDTPYDFTGPTSISSLLGLFDNNAFVWLGLAKDSPYSHQGDCDPGRNPNGRPDWETRPAMLAELPATIEGVVTLHPRYFQKIGVCGSEERYYGSYMLQDSTGGIMVLKDSRIAEFDYGDRVRLRVRGVIKYFETRAVLVYDEQEILTSPGNPEPVYYQTTTTNFSAADAGKVMRVRGRVIGQPNNQNFNEMKLESLDKPGVEWVVSIDKELGSRGISPEIGEVLEVTGPMLDAYGLKILVASLGQLKWINP